MTVPSNVAFQSLAIVATEAIDLEDRSSVVDEEGAYSRIATTGNGAVTVGVTAHSGTVFAGGNVFLRNYSHIHGDIVAKGGLVPEPQEGSAVDGTVSTGITTPARTRVMRRATFSSQTQPGISLEPEVVWTTPVAPGRYAELTLKRASQVTLRAGDYLFNRVNLDTGCRLKIDDSEGTVNLYVQDGIAIKGEISSVDGGFPNLTVSLLGTESVLATAPFRGALIAPNATINLERLDNGARHEGVFYGRRVRVAPDMTVVHHPIPLLIGDIDIDKTTVCSGESYRIAVSTADPANNGAPATVEIDGTQTAVYSGQFEGPGTRRISVIAQGADDTIEAMTQTINVVECAGDVVPPILVGQINWYRPDVANFAVRNAVDFEDGTQTYHWDFGDGTTSDTDVPVVSHDYQAALGITELRHNFDVTVTVSRPGLANSSAQRTFSLINTYVMSKQRGSIEPPVEFASPALEVDGSELVGTATITNREPSAMTFTSETIEYLPCDVNAAATHRTSSTISETVAGGSSLVYEARIAGSSMAATECGISVQLAGTTTDGQLVDSRLAFERPTSLDTGAPVSDAMASILNYVVAQGLVSDPTLITEEELVDLYRARKIPLSATAESFLQAAPAPGDRCDPNNPGTPPESGYSCQPTGAWDTESASWTDPANAEFAPRSHLANAYKGDVLLSRSCNGPVTPIMNTLDQIYTHAGMMTNNMFDLRNSSAEVDWLMKHGNGVMGSPSDGFKEYQLRYLWPGVYSSSVEAAFGEGVPVTTPEGDDFSLHAFGRPGEVQCQGSNTLVYPQVVKPPPTQESLARSALSAAADAGQTINGHYRFYGFSQASDAPVPDAGGPAPIIGPDGTPQTYGNVATHCSSFPRYAAKSKPGGASLDANKLLPLPSSVGTGTPDGLFFYREDVRAAAGQAMYDYLYNMVDRQLMAMEAAADDYWWAGGAVAGAGIVVGAPALIIGGALGTVSLDTSGTLLKWATDAPDDVANQITNCFGSDYCSEGAKDSSNWKHPGDGITVSPDDIMNHYDAPIDGGLYGYHEQMVYRQKRYRPIFQWLPSPGTRTVAGTVYKDESGTLTPVADATVSILGQPDKVEGTDAAGLFSLEAVADGNLQVHAQKIVDGYLNEVDACYKPDADQPEFLRLVDCADFDTFLDATLYSEIALTLDLPSEDFRKVIIEGTVLVEDCDCCGFWTCSDLENRDFYEVCYVSPLDPGPKTFSVPASQLCSDEVGLTIAGTCELIPGTRDVRVEATVSLYEAGDGSCGGGEFESDEFWYADAAEGDTTPLWGDTVVNEGFCTSPLGPPFDCDDRGQFWDFNAQNVVAE